MAPLGAEALGRLEEAEAGGAGIDALHRDPFAPDIEEAPDRRATRQLDLVNAVVAGRVKLELSLVERSIDLASELSSGLRSSDSEAFVTVMLVDDDADRAEAAGTFLPRTNLLDHARRERLSAFLLAWERAIGRVREQTVGSPGYRGG